MNSEDKFKELLNEKLSGKEFPFNAADWDNAQRLIDASREKKRRRIAAIWFGLLLTLGIGAYLVWNMDHTSTQLASQPGPATATSTPAEEAATPAAKTAAAAQETAPADVKKTITARENAPAQPAAEAAASPAQPAIAAERPVAKSAPVAEPAATPKQRTDANKAAAQPQAESRPAKTSPAKQQFSPVEPAVANAPKQQPAQPETPRAEQLATDENSTADVKDQDPGKTAPPVSKPETTAPQADAPASQPAETLAAATPSAETAQTPDAPAAAESASTAAVAQPPVAVKDSMAAVTDATQVVLPKSNFPKHFIFAEAGANFMAGWQGAEKRDAMGFNPTVGIGYMNNFTENFGMSLGVNYTSMGHMSGFSHTSKVTTLGLGEESAVTVITPSRLHYLAVPLKVNLAIDSKNSFGLGYTLAYMLTADSKVETYTQKLDYEQNTNVKTDYASSRERGYTKGFSAFDSQLSVFYRRRLVKELFVNTELQLGLTDLKDNKFFAANSFERSMGIKVTFMYNLFKK